MFRQMLATLTSARGLDRIIVATCDAEAASEARRWGVAVYEECEQRGHSHSADEAALRAMREGARTVILLPIDVPLATAAEVEALASVSQGTLAIVPDAEGTGTNALVRTPPDAIASRFGPGSFRAHLEQAEFKRLAVEVMRPPGLTFDIDTPEDVAELLRRAPDNPIARLCASIS